MQGAARSGMPTKCPVIFCQLKGFVWLSAATDRTSGVIFLTYWIVHRGKCEKEETAVSLV